jgi:hypothetical protein
VTASRRPRQPAARGLGPGPSPPPFPLHVTKRAKAQTQRPPPPAVWARTASVRGALMAAVTTLAYKTQAAPERGYVF